MIQTFEGTHKRTASGLTYDYKGTIQRYPDWFSVKAEVRLNGTSKGAPDTVVHTSDSAHAVTAAHDWIVDSIEKLILVSE
ncbi:hypothetical protein [Myxococcus phage Mx4 ts27htf-1hrm-1]|nr:hypothetical protein [Myxococcus phage Mx4 ts27htf-1hrm-1]